MTKEVVTYVQERHPIAKQVGLEERPPGIAACLPESTATLMSSLCACLVYTDAFVFDHIALILPLT